MKIIKTNINLLINQIYKNKKIKNLKYYLFTRVS